MTTPIVCTEFFHTTTCDCTEKYENKYTTTNIIAKILKYNNNANPNTRSTRMILDTGATKHMSGQLTLFTNLTKVTDSYVTLGDGTTKLQVSGKGTIKINIETFVIELHNVLLVPDLEDTLFSITEHIQSPNYSLTADKNKYTLFYPTFNILARLDNEVHLQISP